MISKLSVRPSDIFMDFLVCDRFEKFKRNVGKRKFNFAINIYLNIFFPPPQKYGQWQFLIVYILLDELEIFFNLKKKTGDIEISFFDPCLPRSESGGVENYRFCVTSGSFHQSFVF